ncbi:MAG: thioredoxin-disulfide reductase [Flavobacteriales bacterium]
MSEQESEHVKCLIIGSGPAGYSAGVYAARADLQPVLYQGMEPGGQLTITTDVENYLGYPDGVKGPEMMQECQHQAERLGTDVRFGHVTEVDLSGPPHKAIVDDQKAITADAVIISTGASAKWLGLESESRLNGFGVSACAVCDGFFFKGEDVAIVGGGDTACEEASYLSKLCHHVYMLVRRDEMRASRMMQHRVMKQDNIEILWNHETDEILGEQEVEGVRVYNNQTEEKKDLDVAGFFVAIGHEPNTGVFRGWLEMDDTGYIKHECGNTRTNVEGVYVSGDAADYIYRQAITAAGTGCMAALDAERDLSAKGLH